MAATASQQEAPPVHLKVTLELPDEESREFTYDFVQSVIQMGRDPTNDVQIPLTTVSRNHARIFWEMGDYFLEDLGSTHGTEHNGVRIPNGEKRLVRDGDSIRVMTFLIMFKTTAGTSLDRRPGENTEDLARRMAQEVLSRLGGDAADPPALRIMNGVDEGKRFDLTEDATEIVLGRSPDCDVTLNDQNVSRRHCLVKRDWHGFSAQDLGSKNGVIRNGTAIQGAELIKDGDELQIGGVKVLFIDPASRILDQIGGPDNATMDPAAAEAAAGEVEEEEEPEPVEEEYPEPDPEPMSEPDIGHEDLEMGMDGEDEDEDEHPEIEIPPELAGARKGMAWDVIILVVGGTFLLAAVGLVLFLVL